MLVSMLWLPKNKKTPFSQLVIDVVMAVMYLAPSAQKKHFVVQAFVM